MGFWHVVKPELWGTPRTERSLFGQRLRCGISKGDLIYMDRILADHEHLTTIIELGTGSGLTTIYYAVAMHLRGGQMITWDRRCPRPIHEQNWPMGISKRQADIYSEPAISEIRAQLSGPNTFGIFDGGLKTKELELFAANIGPQGVVAVHDWASEVDHDVAYRVAKEAQLEPVRWDLAEACLSKFRAWKRV